MKKSTKIGIGIGTGVALLTASLISALTGKGKTEENAGNNAVNDNEEVTNSDEATYEVED